MKDSIVTVIMPAHNSSATIRESINSVIQQSFMQWNLLVVDDKSTDETCEIVREFCLTDQRIQLVCQSKWAGVAAARNKGLELVNSLYTAFLDSDDQWHPTKLEQQLAFMVASGTSITFSSYLRVNERQEIVGLVVPPSQVTYRKMLASNFIGNSTAIFVSEHLKDIRFKAIGNEDHLFWLESLRKLKTPILSVPGKDPLAYYLVRANSLSGNKFKSLSYEWHIYRRELNFSIAKSAFYIISYIYHGIIKRYKSF